MVCWDMAKESVKEVYQRAMESGANSYENRKKLRTHLVRNACEFRTNFTVSRTCECGVHLCVKFGA